MVNKGGKLKIGLALCALLLGAYVVVASHYKSNGPKYKWSKVPPVDVVKLWTSEKYVSLMRTDEIQMGIKKRLTEASSGNPILMERSAQINSLISSFLLAYSQGSFDSFMKFRAPLGAFEYVPSSLAGLDSYLNQAGIDTSSASSLVPTERAVRLLSLHWEQVDAIARASLAEAIIKPEVKSETVKNGKNPARAKRTALVCTRCLTGIAVDKLSIVSLPEASEIPDLREELARQPNLGIYRIIGLIKPNPTLSAVSNLGARKIEYISIEMWLKLSTQFAHPVTLVAYWNPFEKIYMPAAIYIPVSGIRGAKFIF